MDISCRPYESSGDANKDAEVSLKALTRAIETLILEGSDPGMHSIRIWAEAMDDDLK